MDSPADYLDRASNGDANSYLSFDSPPTLPLPSGTYTLLPLVDQCDNVSLPTGPWSGADCKRRWEQHLANQRNAFAEENLSDAHGDSALADDDDDDDGDDGVGKLQGAAAFDKEFLVPFFLTLPTPPAPSASSSGASLRRRSSTASGRPSFSRLTPMPRLRASSPTPSTSSFVRARADPSAAVDAPPIGFLRPDIVRALIDDNRKFVAMNCKPVWSFQPAISFPPPARRPSYSSSRPGSRRSSVTANTAASAAPASGSSDGEQGIPMDEVLEGLRSLSMGHSAETGPWAVGFEDWVNDEGADARREHFDRIVRGWKHAGMFPECLGGWRDEFYTIYGPPPPPSPEGDDNPLATGSNEAFRMERSACALFGFATFGVHCTAYVEEEGEPLKLWVPRRSATKPTWPSMLDNTVAGGITAGDSPRMSIIRECAEEASLSPAFVASRIKQAGVLTYHYRTAAGFLQPEVQYVYDLRLPAPGSADAAEGTQPSTNPADGEVESFELLSLDETVRRMCDGEFKPNCALVLIDFFMRHGLLTCESDTRFLEIAARLRKPLGLPGPA